MKPYINIHINTSKFNSFVSSKQKNTLNFENHSIIEEYKHEDRDKSTLYPLYYYRNIIIEKYLLRIISRAKKTSLSPEQQTKYEMNPYLMSFDSYGTPDYWWLILALNKIRNPQQFINLPVIILLPDIDDLREVLQQELNINNEFGVVKYRDEFKI